MNTIGILGNIGSGKNTVAQYLATKGCIPTSFAGPIKDLCTSVFGWDRELLEGETDESREFREAANNGDAVAKHIMGRDFPNVHTSEYDWIGCDIDFTINNNGTLEDLYANIDVIIDKLPQKPAIFHDNGLEII